MLYDPDSLSPGQMKLLAEYFELDAKCCILCHSENIQPSDTIQVDGVSALRAIVCGHCGAHWREHFELAGVQITKAEPGHEGGEADGVDG